MAKKFCILISLAALFLMALVLLFYYSTKSRKLSQPQQKPIAKSTTSEKPAYKRITIKGASIKEEDAEGKLVWLAEADKITYYEKNGIIALEQVKCIFYNRKGEPAVVVYAPQSEYYGRQRKLILLGSVPIRAVWKGSKATLKLNKLSYLEGKIYGYGKVEISKGSWLYLEATDPIINIDANSLKVYNARLKIY